MNVITFTEARSSLKQVMDEVCLDHHPTVITRQRGEHVVMMSLDDFNSMQETLHLLSSPRNAQRLLESIEAVKAGRVSVRGLMTIGESKDEK